jgi:hypothetical protein
MKAIVVRDGQEQEILARELVTGDIVCGWNNTFTRFESELLTNLPDRSSLRRVLSSPPTFA